jgi:hypothetical protein
MRHVIYNEGNSISQISASSLQHFSIQYFINNRLFRTYFTFLIIRRNTALQVDDKHRKLIVDRSCKYADSFCCIQSERE